MILTGCSQSSGNSLEVSDTSVSGTVESIDGNTITLTTSNGMSGGTWRTDGGKWTWW